MSLVFNSMPVILLHYRIFSCSLRLKLSFVILSERQMIIFIFIKSKMVCHVVTMHFIVAIWSVVFTSDSNCVLVLPLFTDSMSNLDSRFFRVGSLAGTDKFRKTNRPHYHKHVQTLIWFWFAMWMCRSFHTAALWMWKRNVVIHAFHLCPSKVELASENKNGDY